MKSETMVVVWFEVSYYVLMGATYDNLGACWLDQACDDCGLLVFHMVGNASEVYVF